MSLLMPTMIFNIIKGNPQLRFIQMKVLYDKPSFHRCQQILQIFNKQRLNIPHYQIHNFAKRFERSSIRSNIHFKPLQQMILELTPKIVDDRLIATTPFLLGNMASIYSSLNIYSQAWMDQCSRVMLQWMTKGEDLNLDMLNRVYRTFIELKEDRHSTFMHQLRMNIKKKLELQLKGIIQTKRYSSSQFSKQFQFLHRYIRSILLDKQSPYDILNEVFCLFETIFKQFSQISPFAIDEKHYYNNTAASYQLNKVLKIKIPSGNYKSFLKDIYNTMKNSKKNQQQKTPKISERSGESVFENRFQKGLHINGYQFIGNVKIGLSEYDVLLKGKKKRKFIPFDKINYDELKRGHFKAITSQQKCLYESMTGVWYINDNSRLKEDLIINLNGPFHYIVGDKSGIVQSEAIKEQTLKYYGYHSFRQIDFREWEAKTYNQRAVTDYLESIIKF